MTSNRIMVSSDSVCDLPADLTAKLNIRVIPTYVNIGDKSVPDDGIALNRPSFYRELPKMTPHPTTAAPSPGDAETFFRHMLNSGAEHIISIHVPEQLSGVLNAMRLGAKALDEERITLIDSQQLSFGMGFQVSVAAEMAAQDQPLPDILDALQSVRQHTEVFAIIDTMTYMQRSGRVNALVASLSGLLKIKPIIHVVDGDILPLAKMRTTTRAIAKLQALTREQAPLDKLAILHIDNQAGAKRFLDSVKDIAPTETRIVEVTPTIGAHIGPGAIGVATLNHNWRN